MASMAVPHPNDSVSRRVHLHDKRPSHQAPPQDAYVPPTPSTAPPVDYGNRARMHGQNPTNTMPYAMPYTTPAPPMAPTEMAPPLDRMALGHESWGEQRCPWPSSQAVPPEARAEWFESPDYQAFLDQLTHSQALSGNFSQLLLDGHVSFMEKQLSIAEADVIFLKIYQFDNDDAGRRIASELEEAAKRGCRVYVQYGIKSFYSPLQLALIKLGLKKPLPPMLRGLAELPNAVLAPNDKPKHWHKLIFERDHEKYLITWRAGEAIKLIMGGMNISDSWMHGGEPGVQTATDIQYRDTDVQIIGPTAEKAINGFIADMGDIDSDTLDSILDTLSAINKTHQQVLYPPSAENAVVRFVRNKPKAGDSGQFIKALYISLLENVPPGERVRIENAYLLPRGKLRRALINAADRGVIIEIVINSTKSAEREARWLAKAAHSLFRTMLRKTKCPENLHFYEFRGNPDAGFNAMHQKVASFGEHGPYIVGSSNLDEQSLHFNKEVVALIYDGQGRREFDAMWERDVHNGLRDMRGRPLPTTYRLTPEALRKESFFKKCGQRFLSCGAPIL